MTDPLDPVEALSPEERATAIAALPPAHVCGLTDRVVAIEQAIEGVKDAAGIVARVVALEQVFTSVRDLVADPEFVDTIATVKSLAARVESLAVQAEAHWGVKP